MANPQFVHLRVHTYYSLLESAAPVGGLIAMAKKQGMPALAVTDSGNLFAAVDFFQEAKKSGIKPLIGAELFLLSEGSHVERKILRGVGTVASIVMLAKNVEGYQNICRLLSIAHLEGFYYKPRIDKELLKQFHKGCVLLSGNCFGEIGHYVSQGEEKRAFESARWYQELFGEDFYLELMRVGLPHESRVNGGLVEIGKKLGISTVATNEVRYLTADKAESCQVLRCIKTGSQLTEDASVLNQSDQFYFRSSQEMAALFSDVPDAIDCSIQIANKCHFEFDFKTYHFPKFQIEESQSLEDILKAQTTTGFAKRWQALATHHDDEAQAKEQEYRERLELELKLINSMGFAGYFLIVADFINDAKKKGIPVGPGRGSAAGSLVAFCLGITDIDPIPHSLLFERFLNPERISMPDMDIDFCMRRRDEAIHYVSQKYGHVAQIITFGKMKAKAVVRDVGRVLGVPYGDVDRIAKLIPNTLGITLSLALQQEPQLKSLVGKDAQIRRLLSIAQDLEGFPRHASTHAAGVVISDRPLMDFLPLYKGQHDETTTQFDMKGVEKIGLIKFDFLGLKTLTVLSDALAIIKKRRHLDIDLSLVPLDDTSVYEMLSQGDTQALFQLESSGMTDLIVKLKPNTFADIIALVALFRPGPLGSGMVDDFINRKHGRTPITYELPQLEPILKDTYGVIVYQEQVMQIASVLAGFTLGDADLLRRAMGKKKPEEMAMQREKFMQGAAKNNILGKKAEFIFDLMAKFAEYGFNKSHSAAYALVSYHTAYLKAKYRIEFMTAVLTNEMGNTAKILSYMNDCKTMGISVIPPSVNKSEGNFTVISDTQIGFGLSAVKNVGEAAIESILEERGKDGAFRSLVDFCERIDSRRVNRRVIESLIKCGAFDFTKCTRASLIEALEKAIERGSRSQRERESGQVSMFEMIGDDLADTIVSDNIPEWDEHQLLVYEKESLGFYISGHPLSQAAELLSHYVNMTSATLEEVTEKREIRVAGMVMSVREITTRKGERMAFLSVEDLLGTMDIVAFPEAYQNGLEAIKSERPVVIVGESDVGDESVKIIAKEIIGIDDVSSRLTKSIHFHISVKEVSQYHLKEVKEVLTRHPGKCPVYLHMIIQDRSETVLSLPEDYRASASVTLLRDIEQVFGRNITQFSPQ